MALPTISPDSSGIQSMDGLLVLRSAAESVADGPISGTSSSQIDVIESFPAQGIELTENRVEMLKAIIDVNSITTDADHYFLFVMTGSTKAVYNGSGAQYVPLVQRVIGNFAVTQDNNGDGPGPSRLVMLFENTRKGKVYPFIQLQVLQFGTGTPEINFSAHVTRL